MKKTIFLTLLAAALAVTSCKKEPQERTLEELFDAGDLDAIRARQSEIQKEADQARKDLKRIETELIKLDPEKKIYPLVTAIEPLDTIFNHYIEVQGSVKTKDDRQIFAQYNGTLTHLNVREGQYIRKGALIGRVDDGGINEQIAQQRVQLALARTNYERQKNLWDQNIGTEMQYLTAKNNYEALQKGIEVLEKQLTKVNFYAPYSGVVEQIITEQGQVVGAGVPVIRLVGLGSMYVEADVPENYLPDVRRGTKTIVNMEAIDKEYNSSVKKINSTINPASRSFTIEVGVPKSNLVKPNLIATLKINDYTNKDAILIPNNIINEDAEGNQYVFVVESEADGISTVKKTVVELGKTNDENGMIEILSGIEADQQIIAEGTNTLSDGQEVQILPDLNK